MIFYWVERGKLSTLYILDGFAGLVISDMVLVVVCEGT